MALPIAPTPILRGKAAKQFLKIVKEQENCYKGYVSTPEQEKIIAKKARDLQKKCKKKSKKRSKKNE